MTEEAKPAGSPPPRTDAAEVAGEEPIQETAPSSAGASADLPAVPEARSAEASRPSPGARAPAPPRGPRPTLTVGLEPLYKEVGGFRMRLEPEDLARLRELPGSKGRTDRELGEEFFEKQADRFVLSLAEDVVPPAEVRVVVDPYSRQAFLAIDRTIRSILSF
jgi:hypothetical protein